VFPQIKAECLPVLYYTQGLVSYITKWLPLREDSGSEGH